LTFPVVLMMMGAVMDWGWYFSQQMQLSAAVRDAARIGAMTARENDPADAAEEVLMAQIAADGHKGTVRLDVRVEGQEKDESLHVGVAIPYQGPVGIIPVPKEIRASQSLRLEDQAS
jgi:hypothetical protein